MGVSQATVEGMESAGYITAQSSAEVMGFAHVSAVHRMIAAGKLRGERVGVYWFVSVASILEAYKPTPLFDLISKRVRETGVEPKPGTARPSPSTLPMKTPKKMGRPRKAS